MRLHKDFIFIKTTNIRVSEIIWVNQQRVAIAISSRHC